MAYQCEKSWNYDLKRRYKITKRVYDAIIAGQDYRCAICNKHVDEVGDLVMEHDQVTNVLRSGACQACNKLLGFCREDVEILKNAIKYLEES